MSLTADGTGCRLVGDLRAAGIHHRSLGYGSRTAWMRCARPATPRTSRTRMHSGSRLVSSGDPGNGAPWWWSQRPVSAGMLPLLLLLLDRQVAPAVPRKSPRRRPGAFLFRSAFRKAPPCLAKSLADNTLNVPYCRLRQRWQPISRCLDHGGPTMRKRLSCSFRCWALSLFSPQRICRR